MKNIERIQDLLAINVNQHFYKVLMYGMSHSKLLLMAKALDSEPPRRYYVAFSSVKYYEGKMSWRGSNWQLASNEEFKKCWQKLYPLDDVNEPLMDEFFLVESQTEEGYAIKLLVGSAQTSDKMFPDFERFVDVE